MERYYLDRDKLFHFTKGTRANTDNYPYLEFSAPKRLYSEISFNPWRRIMENFSSIETSLGAYPKNSTAYAAVKKAEEHRSLRIKTRIAIIEKNFGEAIKWGKEALKLDPDNIDAKKLFLTLPK